MFGIKVDGIDVSKGTLSQEGYKNVAKKLLGMFDIPVVAITLRGSISANYNNCAAMLCRDGK